MATMVSVLLLLAEEGRQYLISYCDETAGTYFLDPMFTLSIHFSPREVAQTPHISQYPISNG